MLHRGPRCCAMGSLANFSDEWSANSVRPDSRPPGPRSACRRCRGPAQIKIASPAANGRLSIVQILPLATSQRPPPSAAAECSPAEGSMRRTCNDRQRGRFQLTRTKPELPGAGSGQARSDRPDWMPNKVGGHRGRQPSGKTVRLSALKKNEGRQASAAHVKATGEERLCVGTAPGSRLHQRPVDSKPAQGALERA